MRRGDGDDKEGFGWKMVGKGGAVFATDPENGRLKKCWPGFWQRARNRAEEAEFILSVENNLTHICVVPLFWTRPPAFPGVDNCFSDLQIPRKLLGKLVHVHSEGSMLNEA